MPSIEFSVDKRDLLFTLFEHLNLEQLTAFEAFESMDRETVEMILGEAIKLGTEVLAPVNKLGDEIGARYKDGRVTMPEAFHPAFAKLREGGWVSVARNPELGGNGFPEALTCSICEIITGANTAFALLTLLNQGTGHLIESFGTDALINTYCEKVYTGEWGGTMCLTEPQAGSDVGASTTTATPNGDHYLIEGTKIFITNGEHDLTDNIVHAVLARVPGGPKGTRGISLFVVPKYLVNEDGSVGEHNDVHCARIEHKMGIKASPTCVMNFGENGKCKGWLLGELNRGMSHMFQMMNEARLEVGVQGLAGGSAAYMSALGYALQRKQGAHPKSFKDPSAPRSEIIFHPDVRRMLMSMKATVEGMRALIYATGLYGDLSHHHPDAEKRAFYHGLLELLTPLCKAYGSDQGFRICEQAIQVYGGYGYTQEYPVEQYCRDTKIASVYEGTNGIQAIDLMARKIAGQDGKRFKDYMGLVSEKLGALEGHALHTLVGQVREAQGQLIDTAMHMMKPAASGDMTLPLLSATPFLEMFGHFTCAFYLTEAATIAYDKLQSLYADKGAESDEAKTALLKEHTDAAFYHSKVRTAEFFLRRILPRNLAIRAEILANDTSAMEVIFPEESELAFFG